MLWNKNSPPSQENGAEPAAPEGPAGRLRRLARVRKKWLLLAGAAAVALAAFGASRALGRSQSAGAALDYTEQAVNTGSITSPISGTIVEKSYKAGDTIEEAGKSLCVIYDLSYLELSINVDELDISLVKVGQSVEITTDAVEGKRYTGVVTRVSVKGTTSGGMTYYPVTVRIDQTDGLLPGMNVDAEIVVAQAQDVLTIPSAAVQRGGLVLVTKDSPSAANAVQDTARRTATSMCR